MVNQKDLNKRNSFLLILLAIILVLSISLYLFTRTFLNAWSNNLPINGPILWMMIQDSIPIIIGIILAAVVISSVTLNFQTTTESRILTPSMLGFDAVFLVTQVALVFFFGATHMVFVNETLNFFISAGLMILVSVTMFGTILRKNKNNLVLLLLFGMVLSTVLRSFVSWLLHIMEDSDFMFIQVATDVTLDDMNTRILPFIAPIMIAITVIMFARHKTYDALSLGSDNAKNLGIVQEKEFKINLILIAIGMAFATALIGSITFLGFLVVNISRQIFKTHKHQVLFIASALIACIALFIGQSLVIMFNRVIPVTIFIDLIGCSYMFYLIVKENKKL